MKFIPHQYQNYCITRMIDNPMQAFWLDMGLG